MSDAPTARQRVSAQGQVPPTFSHPRTPILPNHSFAALTPPTTAPDVTPFATLPNFTHFFNLPQLWPDTPLYHTRPRGSLSTLPANLQLSTLRQQNHSYIPQQDRTTLSTVGNESYIPANATRMPLTERRVLPMPLTNYLSTRNQPPPPPLAQRQTALPESPLPALPRKDVSTPSTQMSPPLHSTKAPTLTLQWCPYEPPSVPTSPTLPTRPCSQPVNIPAHNTQPHETCPPAHEPQPSSSQQPSDQAPPPEYPTAPSAQPPSGRNAEKAAATSKQPYFDTRNESWLPPLEDATTWAGRSSAGVTQPSRVRQAKPPQTKEQVTAKSIDSQLRKIKREELDAELSELHNFVESWIEEKADKFSVKTAYLRTRISFGSTLKATRKPTYKNALLHHVAGIENDSCIEGHRLRLPELHEKMKDEAYANKTAEEKEAIINELAKHRTLKATGIRASNNAGAQDVRETTDRITQELLNLHKRTGVYGFIFVARSSTHDKFPPGWSATPECDLFFPEVLSMDPYDLVGRLEQWGCNRKYGSSRSQSIPAMQAECSSVILNGLITVTQQRNIQMNYANYDRAIILKHGVRLIGWPEGVELVNPGHLPSNDVRKLRDALRAHTCKWIKLTDQQIDEHCKWVDAQEAAGKVVGKKRQRRSDLGKTHKSNLHNDDVESDSDSGDEDRQPQVRSRGMRRLRKKDTTSSAQGKERRRKARGGEKGTGSKKASKSKAASRRIVLSDDEEV